VFVHWADKHALEGNEKGIYRCAFHWPMITSFVLRVPPVFIVGYFGSSLIDPVLKAIPDFIMHAFELAGGVLPALGIAMTIALIGKKNNFAFFFLAFFVVKYFEMNIMLSAIIGTCVALLIVFNQRKEGVQA
jgi:D-glucosaminate-specific PTS system IIC component